MLEKLNILKRIYNKKNERKNKKYTTIKSNTELVYKIGIENKIQVSTDYIAKVVGKSMNYRPLDIRAKRIGKFTEEDKIDIYKNVVPQFEIIKALIYSKENQLCVDKISYDKLDKKIEDLEKKRNIKMNLLEMDLYSSYVDEFYIIKSYMNKEFS